jgi:hypothetical protein
VGGNGPSGFAHAELSGGYVTTAVAVGLRVYVRRMPSRRKASAGSGTQKVPVWPTRLGNWAGVVNVIWIVGTSLMHTVVAPAKLNVGGKVVVVVGPVVLVGPVVDVDDVLVDVVGPVVVTIVVVGGAVVGIVVVSGGQSSG